MRSIATLGGVTAIAIEEEAGTREDVGLAHVATASFLASRLVPAGGFAVGLAGGAALARAAQRHGARAGYGASLAAMLQTVAIMGPARISVPLTQALSAPMLGRLQARGHGTAARFVACAAIRLATQVLGAAFYVWIVLGGVDAYAGSYDALLARLPFVPAGTTAALGATVLGIAAWTIVASAVQVLIYARALDDWRAAEDPGHPTRSRGGGAERRDDPGSELARSRTGIAATGRPALGAGTPSGGDRAPRSDAAALPGGARRGRRFDPRAVALAAALAFALLLAGRTWALLGAIALWLALAWAVARGDREPLRAGMVLTALIAGSVLAFGLVGGIGVGETLRRTLRAALLVLVATWLRAAAGEDGLREVARRSLGRLRRLPSAREAVAVLDRLGPATTLARSGRALAHAVRGTPKHLGAIAEAVLGWMGGEVARHRPVAPSAPVVLRARFADAALVAVAAATAVAFAAG